MPCQYWRKVVRRVFESELLRRAETAVEFHAGLKVFATEMTVGSRSDERQRTIDAESVTEFHAFVFRQILFKNEVFGDVPAFGVAREDEFAFEFVCFFAMQIAQRFVTQFGVTNNFFVDPAGFADALVFEIKDG